MEADPPVARSEEDQVRRSVFSRCLRNLATSSIEERLAWCATLRDMAAQDANRRQKRQRVETCADANSELVSQDVVVFADQLITAEDLDQQQKEPDPVISGPEATEKIAAVLRSMLDRTCGTIINVLSGNELGFLCYLLRLFQCPHYRFPEVVSDHEGDAAPIPSRKAPPRSKDALYSILANFHFQQCEKIGKRVISNKTATLLAQQDAAAFAAIAAKGKKAATPAAPKPAATSHGGTKVSLPKGTTSREHVKSVVAELTIGEGETEQQDLQLSDTRLFTSSKHPGSSVTTKPPAASASVCDASQPVDDAALRRRILHLVQVLDPVTIQTIMRKLQDTPPFARCTQHAVEGLLHQLAASGQLFYDNGIIYFAG